MSKDIPYKNYIIKPKRDFGTNGFLINGKLVNKGYVVVDKRDVNVMPGATWFQTIKDAKKGINVIIKHGVKNFWFGWKAIEGLPIDKIHKKKPCEMNHEELKTKLIREDKMILLIDQLGLHEKPGDEIAVFTNPDNHDNILILFGTLEISLNKNPENILKAVKVFNNKHVGVLWDGCDCEGITGIDSVTYNELKDARQAIKAFMDGGQNMVLIHEDILCQYCNKKIGSIDFDKDDAKFMSVSFKCGYCNRLNNNHLNQKVNY